MLTRKITVPNVMTDYKAIHGFVHTDPFDSSFWGPIHAKDDKMDVSAWNYYGSMFTCLAIYKPNFRIPFPSGWNKTRSKENGLDVLIELTCVDDWIWLRKGSPYEIPGGRPLIPLYEKDAWMKDYLGYISAYQHEIHCVASRRQLGSRET
jgi:hypothetical protein